MEITESEVEEEQTSTGYTTSFEDRLCIVVWVGFLFVTPGPSDDFRIETSILFGLASASVAISVTV